MAIATNTEKQNLATQYGNNAAYASLHTATPGSTGASEVTNTGSPAYARKALTWTPGTTGTNTATVTFDVPTGITITHAGVWTALTAGTFLDGAALGSSQAFSSQGTYQLTLTFTQT